MVKTYDAKCYDLAVHFLEGTQPEGADTEERRKALAFYIQKEIEFWLEETPELFNR